MKRCINCKNKISLLTYVNMEDWEFLNLGCSNQNNHKVKFYWTCDDWESIRIRKPLINTFLHKNKIDWNTYNLVNDKEE